MVYDASRFKDYFEHDFTYDAGFRRNVGRFGRQTAIVDPEARGEWSYAELDADVNKVAAALAGLGVGAGARVAYQLFNGVEFARLYLATQRLGAVGVPLNYRLSSGETALILRDCDPAVFIFDVTISGAALAAVAAAASSAVVLSVGDVAVGQPGSSQSASGETDDAGLPDRVRTLADLGPPPRMRRRSARGGPRRTRRPPGCTPPGPRAGPRGCRCPRSWRS